MLCESKFLWKFRCSNLAPLNFARYFSAKYSKLTRKKLLNGMKSPSKWCAEKIQISSRHGSLVCALQSISLATKSFSIILCESMEQSSTAELTLFAIQSTCTVFPLEQSGRIKVMNDALSEVCFLLNFHPPPVTSIGCCSVFLWWAGAVLELISFEKVLRSINLGVKMIFIRAEKSLAFNCYFRAA